MPSIIDYLDAHLEIDWLRPERAVCDAIMSARVSEYPLQHPAMEMGCGDGKFTWITLGQKPLQMQYGCDRAFDNQYLHVYGQFKHCDGNRTWPFGDMSIQHVFSNMLYWLNSSDHAFSQMIRILPHGGTAVLCLQDPKLSTYRPTFDGFPSLDCGRTKDYQWALSRKHLKDKLNEHGLRVIDFRYYWTPTIIKIWDTGLRLLNRPLKRMISHLSGNATDSIKREWIAAIRPFLIELVVSEPERPKCGGHQLVYVEKR